MKEIYNFQQIPQHGLTMLFFQSQKCGWSKQALPMVEAFEEKHPEINCLTAFRENSAEINSYANGSTPTFFLFKDGELYNKFGDGRTTLEQLEHALTEKSAGILGLVCADINSVVAQIIKPCLVFKMKQGCESCEEMQEVFEIYAKQNPTKQLFQLPPECDFKAFLGVTDIVDTPIVSVFNRGHRSSLLSFGKKGIKEFSYFVEQALQSIKDQNSCKH